MIGSSENRISYNGNGLATEFPFTFKILVKSDLKVVIVDEAGKETPLTSDYYIDMEHSIVRYPGYSPGAEPPIEEQPPKLREGLRIVLYRDVPITQETALDEHWPFNVIEYMADKLTIICQQIADGINRCFRVSSATARDVETTIPVSPGKSFRWSDDGKRLELMENPETVLAENKAVLNETKGVYADTVNVREETKEYKNTTLSYMNNTGQYMDFTEEYMRIASNEAQEAERQADRAEAYGSKAEVYDDEKTYYPADVVMVESGDVYRCIAESVGEKPTNSFKWQPIAMVKSDTFELDVNGDLMPLMTPRKSSEWDIDSNGDIMPL